MNEPDATLPARELWGVAILCLALAMALYAPALTFWFHGDDIWFLRPNPSWLRDAFAPQNAFHYYPLNQVLLYVLPALTGRRPEVMHALNVLLHAGVGLSLYVWLRRLRTPVWACLAAALFLVSRGIAYEVVTWVTEMSYLLVVLLGLLTLSWWHAHLSTGQSRYRVRTVLGFAAALLIFEHALVLVPLYFVFEFLFHPDRSLGRHVLEWTRVPLRDSVGRLWRGALRYLPFVVIVVAFLGLKYSQRGGLTWSSMPAVVSTATAPMPSGEVVMSELPDERRWQGMLNSPRRAYLDLLLSTGYLFLPSALAHSGEDHLLTRHAWWFLAPWLGAHVLLLWKGTPLVRFLVFWVYAYMAPLALGGVPAARYYYMAVVPAAALVGLGLYALRERLQGWMPRRVAGVLLTAALGLVIVGEALFIRARLAEWEQASDLLKRTLALMQAELGPTDREVYLLNVPRLVPGAYFPAYAFGNAAEHLHLMVRPPREGVRTYPVYDRSFVEGRWPTIGAYVPRDTLVTRLRQPGVRVYEFVGRPPWMMEVRE